jgi:transcriptional/translational regulatory protein YebC/TACO1
VARQEFIAHTRIEFDEPALQKASEMLDELEALEDVVKVYDNIESSSEKTV